MRVRTIRTHYNPYGASYEKHGSSGVIYDVDETTARRLIRFKYVEGADDDSENRGTTRAGAGSSRTAKKYRKGSPPANNGESGDSD